MTADRWPRYKVYKLRADVGDEHPVYFHDKMLRPGQTLDDARPGWEQAGRKALELKRGVVLPKFDLTVTEYPQPRTWVCSWFAHWTFRCDEIPDAGAALASFQDYVWEIEREFPPELASVEAVSKPGYVCLMGAEDRWRWRGAEDDGGSREAPCDCKHCEEAGLWQINH